MGWFMAGDGSKALLSREEVGDVYREPFILKGYRQTETSFYQCVKYALVLHNEVGNFWTHFIPLLLWQIWFSVLHATTSVDFYDPYNYPLVCFWAGSCSYALFSSIAHLFGSKSYEVRTVCFLLDYLGIAMYALGGDIAYLFYMQPSASPCFQYRSTILILLVIFALSSTLLCSLSRFYWRDYRFIIRVSSYGIPYLCCIGPYVYRSLTCWKYGTDCVPETRVYHAVGVLITAVVVFFFVTKIPERLSPGRFDFFFQSHQLFHVSTACLTSLQMYFIPLEASLRREALSKVEGATPTWQTTFLPFVCTWVSGVVLVAVLGYLAKEGILITNKHPDKRE